MAVINPPRARRVQYPESDGKPLGETDQHRDLMTDLIFALKLFLANVRAYVAGNLFIYFEEGNPKAVVAPDVFVVLGVQQRQRRIYCSWREQNRLPDVVIELTSKKTRKADEVSKPALYARLGVREYFLFDPYGEYLDPRLQALTGERLPTAAEAELARRAAEAGRKAAEERLEAEAIARLEAETRAAEQAARAAAAEAELARLRALLEKKGE